MNLQGIIVATGQEVLINVPTARIPELPPVVLPYDIEDKLALYDSSEDKTAWTSISDFITYINSGGEAPVAPVVKGNKVEITISPAQAGSYQVANLPLAGKTFSLERRGTGMLKSTEYNILPSGGFELTDHNDLVEEGEVFIAHVYEYEVEGPAPGGPTGSSVFLKGMAIIQSSTALDSTYYNKLIHVAGGNNKVTITLPDVLDCPGLTVPFETMINNNHQTKINCKAGQVIYFGNESQTELYLGKSEYIWLMAGTDGWYVMKASEGLLTVGQPFMDYVQRLNSYKADGSLANRSDYPRLWKFISANPDMIVSDALWNTKTGTIGNGGYIDDFYGYKSKFSEGDGSTTFRFPDHRDLGYVGLKDGYDAERTPNTPGMGQGDSIRSHSHPMTGQPTGKADRGGANVYFLRENSSNPENNLKGNFQPTGFHGGRKTVGKNVGLIPLIRI